MKISGIYAIENKVNGHRYIGSSVDVKKRWYEHKRSARSSRHHSPYFQRAWNKYGEGSFRFVLLETSEPIVEKLEYIEQSYIFLLNPSYNALNIVRHRGLSDHAVSKLSNRMTAFNKKNTGRKASPESIKSGILSRMRLTESEIFEIADLYKRGWMQKDLAKKYRVLDTTIQRIVNNKISIYPNLVESPKLICNYSRYSDDRVREIRRLRNVEKESVSKIATMFSMHETTVRNIAEYKIRKNVLD